MSKSTTGVLIVCLAIVGVVMLPTSADARIRCKGPWQVVDGNQIASPYCGDNYLARVARGYGIKVSGRQLLRSYTKKQEVCQLIGHDNRVSDICIGFRDEYDGDRGRGRGRR